MRAPIPAVALALAVVVFPACANEADPTPPSPRPTPSPPAQPSPALEPVGPAAHPAIAPPNAFTSGTRLVARHLRHAGTGPLLLGVHDRLHGVDCRFERAPGEGADAVRCVPTEHAGRGSLSPTDWARGRVALAPAGAGRLTVPEVHTDDGGRFPHKPDAHGDLVDLRSGAPCSSTHARSGEGGCWRTYALFFGSYADPACTIPLGIPAWSSAAPGLVPTLGRGPAGEPRAVGRAWTGPQFSGSPDACRATGALPAEVYVLGAPLPADEVAPLVVAARGSGRLALWEIEEGGRRVATLRGPSDAFADRELRRDCTPMRTTTAGVRCVPTEVAYVEPPTSFADAACTRPVVAHRPAELVAIARPGHAAGLRTATELRRVGPHVGHELFRLWEGRCEPDLARVPHWELGERVSWEGFAALEEWLGDERAP